MKNLIAPLALAAALTSLSTANDAFSRFDANGDGMVTFEELARAKTLEFDRLDRDRDRTLSAPEFGARPAEENQERDPFDLFDPSSLGTADLEGRSVSLAEYRDLLRELINRLDTTADNAVSEEEYEAAVSAAKEEAAAAP
ncbi:MAG: EF-hand domain-containing protein [Verrucomicrobiales bacterium]